MAFDIETVAQAIQSVIASTVVIPGSSPTAYLRATDYMADNFTPPCALVAEAGRPEVHTAMGNQSLYQFEVWLILPRAADRAQLQAAELYASATGTSSIQAALEADQSLGGIVGAGLVTKIGAPMNIQVNGNPYLARTFTYRCLAGS